MDWTGSINGGVGVDCGGGGGAAGLFAVGFESTGEMAGSVVSAAAAGFFSMVGGVVDGCVRSFEVDGPLGVLGAGTVVDVPLAWIDKSPSYNLESLRYSNQYKCDQISNILIFNNF